MKRSLHLAIVLLLLLSACGGGPRAVERYVGTDGVVIEFAQNAPPETVYENTAFPARVMVRNAGATDIPAERMVLTFSVDPLYISGGISPYFPAERDTEHEIIYGKSPAFPDGQLIAYSMPIENAFSANGVLGQREQPETTIVAGVCYGYTTHYSASVCIDTNSYEENLRAQPCEAEDLTASGGQGAPIAITGVRVQAFPIIDRELGIEAVRPQFTFTIEDVGDGQLVGPDTLELASACLLRGIAKEELGAVRIEAYLLNTPLECQPDGLVRLIEGTGEVRCTVPKNELSDPLYASAQNYMSTLIVNLSYIYKSSTSVTVAIERGLGDGGQIIPVGGRVTGYEYVRAGADVPSVTLPEGEVQLTTTGPVVKDATGAEWQLLATPDGQPVTSCDLYANNPELIPDGRGQLESIITPAWNCACGQTRCTTLSRSGQCVAGLCPGNTYCCTDVKPVKPTPEPTEPTEPGTEPEQEPTPGDAPSTSGLATAWPADDRTITSCFGTRDGRTHRGLDMRAGVGDPVYAIASGTVERAYVSDSFGTTIVLRHSSQFASRYAHLSDSFVADGQTVQAGERIGLAGESGNVQAPHLHLEIYDGSAVADNTQDPLCFFSSSMLQSASFKSGQNCQSLGYTTPATAVATACPT